MEKDRNLQRPRSKAPKENKFPTRQASLLRDRGKIGTERPEYLNENCWLIKTLGYSSAKRCQYCELKFLHCLFFQYLIASLVLIFFSLTLSFLIEGEISRLIVISVFTLVIVYGYFFNKSTEKIIKANFAQKKANEALEELTKTLEERVEQRTKELKKAYEKLRKLDIAKSEFISIASHQLRTPLTAIKGYISMILEKIYGTPPEKMEKSLENIYLSNERLIKLVNDLLSVSRIEAGRMEIKSEKTSIEELISSVVGELENEAKNKNIYLKFEKLKEPLPKISVDRDKIREAVSNLVDNAIKYTERGGVIIKLKIENSKLKIIISDTGAGMTKDELSKIFESFSRGAAGTQLYTEGVGLGLYIARRYTEMNNGKIWAESKGKDKGSIFYIELPLKNPAFFPKKAEPIG